MIQYDNQTSKHMLEVTLLQCNGMRVSTPSRMPAVHNQNSTYPRTASNNTCCLPCFGALAGRQDLRLLILVKVFLEILALNFLLLPLPAGVVT